MSRLWVVELSDNFGPTWPYGLKLRVGVAASEPGYRIATLAQSKRAALREIAPYVVRARPDLCTQQAYPDPESASAAKAAAIRKLKGLGHWVNGAGAVYKVYVVELDDDVGPKTGSPNKPWLYVGETALEPAQRIAQHRSGARNKRGRLFNKHVKDHFVRVREDLSESIAPVHTREASVALEGATVRLLERQGYSVKWG